MKDKRVRTLPALAAAVACLVSLLAASGPPRPPYREVFDRLREAGLAGERAHDLLERIVSVGPRLTGSPQAAAAVRESLELMGELGLQNVHSEPVEVGRWVRGIGRRSLRRRLRDPGRRPARRLRPGRNRRHAGERPHGPGRRGPVPRRARQPRRDPLKGKIVFFNRPMDRRVADPFAAYGGAADQRVDGASAAARHGAVAVLVRSLTFRDGPLSPHGADALPAGHAPRAGGRDQHRGRRRSSARSSKRSRRRRSSLRMDCRNEGPGRLGQRHRRDHRLGASRVRSSFSAATSTAGTSVSAPTTTRAGCAAALEAVRLIKDLGLRPRRTVRVVFFMDEEFGGTGGRAYVAAPERRGERHLVAAESDRGGFVPVGLAVGGRILRRSGPSRTSSSRSAFCPS